MKSAQIVLFVRAPEVGKVKTRLIAKLGDVETTELYVAFVEDMLGSGCRFAIAGDVNVVLSVAGNPNPTVQDWASRFDVEVVSQSQGDLGMRLASTLEVGLRQYESVLVLGSDSPTLPEAWIRANLQALTHADLVVGPSHDGGYYAIGASCRSGPPNFEEVRWSTPHTLADTVSANKERCIAQTSPWYDIDCDADLELLQAHLSLDPRAAPLTADWLRRHTATFIDMA